MDPSRYTRSKTASCLLHLSSIGARIFAFVHVCVRVCVCVCCLCVCVLRAYMYACTRNEADLLIRAWYVVLIRLYVPC